MLGSNVRGGGNESSGCIKAGGTLIRVGASISFYSIPFIVVS